MLNWDFIFRYRFWSPALLWLLSPLIVVAEDWVMKGSDPSELISRVEVRNEYISLPDDGQQDSSILRIDYAPTEEFALKIETPFVDLSTSGEDGVNTSGLGDTTLGARGKVLFSEELSFLAGFDSILDSASNSALGENENQLLSTATLVWKPDQTWIFAMQYNYTTSLGDAQEEISQSLIRPGILAHLPHGMWIWLDPKISIINSEGCTSSLFLEAEYGVVLTQNIELWVRGGNHIAGNAPEELQRFKAELGLRYLFHAT
jgi:hypothetical protein